MLLNCLADKLEFLLKWGELWPDLNLITLKPNSWLEWRSEEGGGKEKSALATTAQTL